MCLSVGEFHGQYGAGARCAAALDLKRPICPCCRIARQGKLEPLLAERVRHRSPGRFLEFHSAYLGREYPGTQGPMPEKLPFTTTVQAGGQGDPP